MSESGIRVGDMRILDDDDPEDAKASETLMSGAIDSEDPITLSETIGAPDWVLKELNK